MADGVSYFLRLNIYFGPVRFLLQKKNPLLQQYIYLFYQYVIHFYSLRAYT